MTATEPRLNRLAAEWMAPANVTAADLYAECLECVLCGRRLTADIDPTGLACRLCGESELEAIRHGERSPFEADNSHFRESV